MKPLSNRVLAIVPSPTLAISTKAKDMQQKGINVVNFGVGEPDFSTPQYIKEAAQKAIEADFTKYTANAGIIELREAICQKFIRDNGLEYTPKQILTSPGAKASIINTLLAVCESGDQVIIPVPYWVSYPYQVMMSGATPLYLETKEENQFKIQADELDRLLQANPKVKAIILNTPSNPTGSVYSLAELEKLAEVILKYDILVISDEIYEKLVYGGTQHFSIASVDKQVQSHVVIINGVSKAFAMTGWRLGYLAGPEEIVAAAGRIQEHASSCVNSITQKAVVTALNCDDGSVEMMRKEFEQRKNYMLQELNSLPHISCTDPQGAFYIMPNISYYLKNNNKGIRDSYQLCNYLLDNHHIALVAGAAFGCDQYVRFSYANSMANLQEGTKRFATGLQSLLTE